VSTSPGLLYTPTQRASALVFLLVYSVLAHGDQASLSAQLSALRTQVVEAYRAKETAKGEKLFEEFLDLADTNRLGADPVFSSGGTLIANEPDPGKRLNDLDRFSRILSRDNPDAATQETCSLVMIIGMPSVVKGETALTALENRFPSCKDTLMALQPKLKPVIQMSQGNYSGIVSVLKQRWQEEQRGGSRQENAVIPTIVFFSLLDGDVDDAKRYVPFLEQDYRLYDKPESLSLPGLPEMRQLEKLDSGTGYGAISLAAYMHLKYAPNDDAAKRNALQMLLTAKSTGVDDARVTVNLLSDPGSSALARKVIAEYGYSANLWAKINLLRRPISSEEEQAAIQRMQELERELRTGNAQGPQANRIRQAPRIADVQAQLGSNDALVEFCQAWWMSFRPGTRPDQMNSPITTHYVAYVLRNNGSIYGVDLGDAATVNQTIASYRSLMRPGAEGQDWQAPAHRLYQALWKPLLSALPPAGSSGRIFVSPESDLTLLPFDSLMTDNGKVLVQLWDISYLTSGRQLVEMSHQSEHGNGVTVFADQAVSKQTQEPPTHQSRGTKLAKDYAPLPYTAKEASAIRKLFANATLHTGPEATKSALKSVSSPTILHIATHGYYLESPESAPDRASKDELLKKEKYSYLRSGLILQPSIANSPTDEDRVMTSLEIALLDLKNTDLVVLSACDSGVGDTTPGDSVSGLRSAFQIAGAKSVVSSLWTINDEKGEAFMEAFYKNLAEAGGQRTQTINQSLRQAKLALVNQHEHPYYWASFVLDGTDQPISSQR